MAEPSKYGRGNDAEDDDGDDDDEAVAGEAAYKAQKDAVLFAIDVSESMLTKPSDGDVNTPGDALSPTLAALKCAYALMQQRIISNPNDMMGILLFGTVKSKFEDVDEGGGGRGGLQHPHCYLLTDLDVPAAADVKQLRTLVEDEDAAKEILQPSKEEVSMTNVLFCANQIFTTKAPNFSSRRLFLVTDNDYPHASNRDARNSAAVRAKDLYDLGVTIELFPISHPERGHTFDRSKFYDDIVYSATPSDPNAPAPVLSDIKAADSSGKGGISLLQSLLSSVASRNAPRRTLFNLPFEIGPGLRISIKGFIIFKRQEPKRTSYVYLPPDGEKAQIAKGSGALLADDTARHVEKVEVRKAYKFGGETISFTPEELAKIKSFGDPVLRIIGFKPMSMLPTWASTKPCTFIYPSEEGFVGSTRVFSALQQKLLRDQKMGLAWFVPRKNATPTLCAIMPGDEKRNEDGEQVIPPGLWIKPLPFADDIREPPETHLVKAPDEVIDAMRLVVQQLQLPKAVYDPRRYPNPSLQWFYKILQAMALDEDLPEAAEDKTLPRWKQIHKRAGQYVVEWGQVLDQAFGDWQETYRANFKAVGAEGRSKRPTTDGAAYASSKKVKAETDDGAVSDAGMRKAYQEDALSKLKVAELKAWLQRKGQDKGLNKKQDLVDAVTRWFETKMDVD